MGPFGRWLPGLVADAGPSIRTVETATDTLVLINADGDNVTDARVILDGTQGLTSAEFIL